MSSRTVPPDGQTPCSPRPGLPARPEPAWDLGTATPVPMCRWGKDHWGTFAYVDTRWVDHCGMLDHDRMRCDRLRHPVFYSAKGRPIAFGTDVDGARYPTRLKTETPGADGSWGVVLLADHDDYDCLADAIHEGLIEVAMPRLREPRGDAFIDARGRPVRTPDGQLIDPSFITGLSEMCLMTAASFVLTQRGQVIAAELRAHLAVTRKSHQFMPSCAAAALASP